MKHQLYNPDFKFEKDPIDFDKYTNKDLLQYCLGATLYMPGTKNIIPSIVENKLNGLTSMVMCFEDAIAADELSNAEDNVVQVLNEISQLVGTGKILHNNIPLIFLRVRNADQFVNFSKKITPDSLKFLTGFVFPKFGCKSGHRYLEHLSALNNLHGEILYGMPILESEEIAYKESRLTELNGIINLLKPFKKFILNIRVGATDFSSKFGVRRGIDYSIYDILTVRDCLSDILNIMGRVDEGYVLSAPVWEYFLADREIEIKDILEPNIHTSLLKRNSIINDAIDGLLREVIIDKANGFVGKTIIHPSHMKYINAMQTVTKEEYEDALQILGTHGGVVKSANKNKMNEINPHRSWAIKTSFRAQAYGVISNETEIPRLFTLNMNKR